MVAIEGIAFASALTATYTNVRRIDHTRCPIGPSHDAAQYSGRPPPSPPLRRRRSTWPRTRPRTARRFTDTSTPGAGGAPIVARLWRFGDPASGGRQYRDRLPGQPHVLRAGRLSGGR